MTQIKLRRDTSANFTSKNPVLGVGEPAYETDTKKLKIGDGTTAYTQLEYFSAGGGSSTNISATLPLKIVDGVISLEVDGQTIQVVDGKLHANLDELGNEVNSLTGEVTELSGRVTAAEADIVNKASKSDLAAKQDKLNTIAPLGINQTTISNVTDGTFLTDTLVQLNTEFSIYFTTDITAHPLIYSTSGSLGETPTSFIQIPFSLGDVISLPSPYGNNCADLAFGYWKDSLFYPTAIYGVYNYYGSGSNTYPPLSWITEVGKDSTQKITTNYGGGNKVAGTGSTTSVSANVNGTCHIQIGKIDGIPYINVWQTPNANYYPNSVYTWRIKASDEAFRTELEKTNVALLLKRTSTTIDVTKVGRYEVGDMLDVTNADALLAAKELHPNSFDATAKVVTNDLSLALGSGLAITDGKLTASSTAPSNMVTTDTAQNITGGKTFQEHITIGNTGAGQIDKLRLAALNGSSTAVTLYNGLQIYTDIRTYTSTLRVGDVELPMILQGSTIKDSNGNNFLKTKSLTQSEYDGLTTKDDTVLYVITD